MITKQQITGIILAGGAGSRMGGRDKGWVTLNNQPLVSHVIDRIKPQVSTIIISANRELHRYQSLGYPVVSDTNYAPLKNKQQPSSGFQGPIAGILAALKSIHTPYAVIIPVDAPLLSVNLVQTLIDHHNASQNRFKLTLFHDGERTHPLFGLYHCSLIECLETYYLNGQRRLMQWCLEQSPHIISTPQFKTSFTNINDPDSLAILESSLRPKP